MIQLTFTEQEIPETFSVTAQKRNTTALIGNIVPTLHGGHYFYSTTHPKDPFHKRAIRIMGTTFVGDNWAERVQERINERMGDE